MGNFASCHPRTFMDWSEIAWCALAFCTGFATLLRALPPLLTRIYGLESVSILCAGRAR